MQITIDLDDELVRCAKEFTGMDDLTALATEALTRLIQHEAARKVAAPAAPIKREGFSAAIRRDTLEARS